MTSPLTIQDHTSRDAKQITLVAIDLDGTLLGTDKLVSKTSAEAIAATLAAGVHVVLASARPPRAVREIYHSLKLDSPQINYNGALIHDPATGDHIHHQPLDGSLAFRIATLARQIDPHVVVHAEVLDQWLTDRVDETLEIETSRTFEPDFIGPLDEFLNQPITKLMFLAPPSRLAGVRKAIQEHFKEDVNVAVSDPHLIQVIDRRVDKGHAVEMIASRLGVNREDVMAIGDAPNDVGMIRWAGLGIAVTNAWPEAIEAADTVVESNDDHGVASALQRYVLGA